MVALNSVAKLLVPPTFPDEGKTIAVRKLWGALLGNLVAFTGALVLLSIAIPGTAVRCYSYMAATDTGVIALLYLAGKGHPRMASTLALLFFAGTLTTLAWSAGGVRAPGLMGFLVLVSMAGMLLGTPGVLVTTSLCIAASFALLLAERTGHLPPSVVNHTATSVWVVLVFALLDLAIVQVIANWVVQQAEKRARASAEGREAVERARHETEAKFVTVFAASPDAIVITELESGRIIEANPSYEKLFGYARDELIGRTTVELGIFEKGLSRQPMIDALRETGAVRDWEMNVQSRSGERVPLLFSGQVVQLGDRECLVAVIHDITRRKQSEVREREVRDEFTRKLFQSQETERRRIAGELHDSLGQNLILIKNRTQLGINLTGDSPKVRAQFDELYEMASQAIAEVRQISHDLRPHQLDQLGLTRALESMFEGAAENSHLRFDLKLDPVDDLFEPDDATHLYRVAQESLSNILKHAYAKSVRIGMDRDLHSVRFWIEDDGHGFAAPDSQSRPRARGLGLSSIFERVRILGGRLEVKSLPGTGTRIDVEIPRSAES